MTKTELLEELRVRRLLAVITGRVQQAARIARRIQAVQQQIDEEGA